jgi:hypothetical protein
MGRRDGGRAAKGALLFRWFWKGKIVHHHAVTTDTPNIPPIFVDVFTISHFDAILFISHFFL